MKRRRMAWITAVSAIVGLLLAGVAAMAAPARSSGPAGDSPTAQQLREIEQRRLQALVDADMEVVGLLHAETFTLVNPAGFTLSREEYLAAVSAGDIDYLTFDPISGINVRLYGQAAVLTYRSHIDIVVDGLGHFTHDAWHTYLYERLGGRWQAVWEQATAIGGFPPQ